ncbi:hypothetical protein [Methylobacterium sp. 285MFTsu5.1]|nr:hypothetical protein [Methylobacterium sp. 285MFTsu5.1]
MIRLFEFHCQLALMHVALLQMQARTYSEVVTEWVTGGPRP